MNRDRLIQIAKDSFAEWGIDKLGWKFRIDEVPKRRLGVCRHREKTIGITGWFIDLNKEEQVVDTLLHEIAHVLVGGRTAREPGDGPHGPTWRAMCLKVGAIPRAKAPANNIVCRVWLHEAECGVCETRHRRDQVNRGLQYEYVCSKCGEGGEDSVINFGPKVSFTGLMDGNHRWTREKALEVSSNPQIESLLSELASMAPSRANKSRRASIRGKLRKLGHVGGLRGAR